MGVAAAQRAFRAALVRAAGLGLVAGGMLVAWRFAVGGGFLLGLGAGLAAYAWLARNLTRLGEVPPEKLMLHSTRQAMARLGIYAVALAVAYRLDTQTSTGLLGALGGYLFVRIALTVEAWRGARRSAAQLAQGTENE